MNAAESTRLDAGQITIGGATFRAVITLDTSDGELERTLAAYRGPRYRLDREQVLANYARVSFVEVAD